MVVVIIIITVAAEWWYLFDPQINGRSSSPLKSKRHNLIMVISAPPQSSPAAGVTFHLPSRSVYNSNFSEQV